MENMTAALILSPGSLETVCGGLFSRFSQKPEAADDDADSQPKPKITPFLAKHSYAGPDMIEGLLQVNLFSLLFSPPPPPFHTKRSCFICVYRHAGARAHDGRGVRRVSSIRTD